MKQTHASTFMVARVPAIIDIRHHYVRELVDHGQIELAFIPTAEMVADLQ